jgi:hypothetical protein
MIIGNGKLTDGTISMNNEQDAQCRYIQRTVQARSQNRCCRGKASCSTYSECVSVALVIQNARRMRRNILSSVLCQAIPHFCILSHKVYNLKLLNIKCVFWLSVQLLPATFLILRITQPDTSTNVHTSSWTVPLFWLHLKNLNFHDRF